VKLDPEGKGKISLEFEQPAVSLSGQCAVNDHPLKLGYFAKSAAWPIWSRRRSSAPSSHRVRARHGACFDLPAARSQGAAGYDFSVTSTASAGGHAVGPAAAAAQLAAKPRAQLPRRRRVWS